MKLSKSFFLQKLLTTKTETKQEKVTKKGSRALLGSELNHFLSQTEYEQQKTSSFYREKATADDR